MKSCKTLCLLSFVLRTAHCYVHRHAPVVPHALLRGLSLYSMNGDNDDADKRAQDASAAWAGARAAVLGDMTMEEVFEKWHSEKTHREMRDKLKQIGAYWPSILHVMNRGQTIEKVLHEKRIIVLSYHEEKDIAMMNERIVDIDASHNELMGWNQATGFGKILYAIGPSGKGRSFIGRWNRTDSLLRSYDWTKTWERNKDAMHTTVYVDTRRMRDGYWSWRDENASSRLFGWIRGSLHKLYPILYDADIPLGLHLTVVLDGAFGLTNDEFMDKRDYTNQLYGRLIGITSLWKETRVIVLGTDHM
jgi:hypothetical protein